MPRRLLLISFSVFVQLSVFGQRNQFRDSIKLTSDSVLASGNPLTARLIFQPLNGSTVNSVVFRDGITDTAYRYSATRLRAPGVRLELGTPVSPGLFFLETDTVSSLGPRESPQHIFGFYRLFVHPEDDDSGAYDNTKNRYPVQALGRNSFQAEDWVLLDSLITRIHPDTITNRIGTLMANLYAQANCDSLPGQAPNWEMALIISVNADGSEGNLSIVLDPKGSAPIDTAGILNACFGKFEFYLLDSSSLVLEPTTISADTRHRVVDLLNAIKGDRSRFDIYISSGFVRQAFELQEQIDVLQVCEDYCVYRTKNLVEQLVFVMKLPVPR